MTRLARGRETHLSRGEIAAVALRRFDEGKEASIRELAAELGVAPSAIYHHFPSRTAIVDEALGLVWREAAEEGMRLIGDRIGDPVEVLLTAALATRRAFGRHHAIAPYLAATQAANERLVSNLGLLAGALEGLGLSGEEAAEAFHAYGSYAIGSTLVLAARLNFGAEAAAPSRPAEGNAEGDPTAATRRALEGMMDLSYSDPKRDEELFLDGLRRLIASFTPG
jgi:AcrR family transcriptional regulator